MKKIIGIFLMLFVCLSSYATDFTGVKIYINPGHGGYNGANDRNIATINFALGDTLGFWESWSNLQKGLALRDMLQVANATVYMSRTQNRDEDDRLLSEIAEEANANGVDAFLSIHSNALATNTGTNYLLLLFHGYDTAPTVAASLPMAQAAWTRLIDNGLTVWTNYATTTNIRGDYSFYGNTSGLGVLRPLTVPGFLSEGSFHDYQPETHRLLNQDYRKLEATNFYKYFCDYFQRDLPATGVIAGFVKGKDQTFSNSKFTYKSGTHDRWLPLNGANIKLMNSAGDSLNNYTVDTLYNGVFAFHNLAPGNYKLRFSVKDHLTKDTTVTVVAATTTYAKMMLVNPSIVLTKDTTPDYPEPVQEAGVIAMSEYKFDVLNSPSAPEWLNQKQIKKVVYRNEKLYVLTTEPKILVVNASTNALIREMDLAGVSSGVEVLSDIAFTSDGYLLACNKDSISLPELKGRYFKVYTWDNDSVAPKLLFQTQYQASWSTGVVGETFAVSGPRWKCTFYTPAVTVGTSKQIRIMGLQYEEGVSAIGYKYMMDVTNYTEGLWGKKYKFSTSTTGSDHFYIDSDKLLPTEYQFNWGLADRSALVKKAAFAEKSGYVLQPVASGIQFFRHAKHVFMVSPVCGADSTAVGVAMFDVTDGLNNAKKLTVKYPEMGLGTQKATYMMAAGKVTGYDIDLIILAQQQGIARYRTVSPTAKANVYASELSLISPTCVDCVNTYEFGFTLNADAENVNVNIMKGTEIAKVIPVGPLAKGVHSIPGNFDGLAAGDYAWAVEVTGSGVDRPVKVSDNADALMQFNYPRSVSVDNNFESRYFGRVYVSESAQGTLPARTTRDGVYILNSALQDITNQGANAYNGAVAWGSTSSSSPMRLSVGEDGNVYICDWSDAHPGVWVMNPERPADSFVPVFNGLTKASSGLSSFNGVDVHGSIAHCYSTGTGDETKLFTFDEDYVNAEASSAGNLLQYNIGKLTAPYQAAPIVVYNDALNGNLQQNMNSCIAPDARGGWWISQYRSADASTIPSLIHVNTAGLVDFNSGLTPTLVENSNHGGMAVSADGTKLAMGCANEIKIFSVAYNTAGVPVLTRLHSIKPALGASTAGLSFDRAGNVYAVSFSDKRMGVWALPKADQQFTTPAPSTQTVRVVISAVENIPSADNLVLVYPNPTVDRIVVESKEVEVESYGLFDLKGQLIASDIVNTNKIQISLRNFQSGVYVLKVKTSAGTSVRRIIKN